MAQTLLHNCSIVAVSARLLTLTLITASLIGCGSASTTLSPTPLENRCGITLTASGTSFAASGGIGTLKVDAARECTWSIAERPAWMSLTSVPNPQGALEISFTVQPNRSTASRSGDVVIGDQRTRFSQEAATCPWRISPSDVTVTTSGGDVSARLTTDDFCSWEVASPPRWLDVTPRRGQGSGEITFKVAANTGERRSSRLQVGGTVIEIEQRSASPAVPSPPAAPGSPTPPEAPEPRVPPVVTPPPSTPAPQAPAPPVVTPPPAAPVPQAPPPPVVTPPAPAPPPNAPAPPVVTPPSPPQTPAPPVVTPPVPVPPRVSCTYTVSLQRVEVSRKSREVDISIQTQPSCELRAATSADWLDVSPKTRTGPGKLELDVKENKGAPRIGAVTLTGEGFTAAIVIVQEGRTRGGNGKGDKDDDD